tara:strand:+ start:357 stop:1205 length:849 start_codon:yes stop_codon:yes gene_type:complete
MLSFIQEPISSFNDFLSDLAFNKSTPASTEQTTEQSLQTKDPFAGINPNFFLGASALGGVGQLMGLPGFTRPSNVGYQGSVPDYTAVRARVPNTYDPNRRPGSGGLRYFSDTTFVPSDSDGIAAARAAAEEQAKNIAATNLANPARAGISSTLPTPAPAPAITPAMGASPASGVINLLPVPKPEDLTTMAEGGIAELQEGRYLRGNTDGMADEVPAMIDKEQPAALSDGEYVIPADVVSHLGNGNSDAGAKVLDNMMEKVRKARTGNKKQGKEIDPKKFLPV